MTTAVAAHRHGIRMQGIYPENTLLLAVDGEMLLPDARFDLVNATGRFRFLIEQDCSTETIRSTKHDDTVQRKLRLHDSYQDQSGQRHRVLFVTSRSRERLTHILDAAASIVHNPGRTLFLGVYLSDYVNANDPLMEPLFTDHRGRLHPMLPRLTVALDPLS